MASDFSVWILLSATRILVHSQMLPERPMSASIANGLVRVRYGGVVLEAEKGLKA